MNKIKRSISSDSTWSRSIMLWALVQPLAYWTCQGYRDKWVQFNTSKYWKQTSLCTENRSFTRPGRRGAAENFYCHSCWTVNVTIRLDLKKKTLRNTTFKVNMYIDRMFSCLSHWRNGTCLHPGKQEKVMIYMFYLFYEFPHIFNRRVNKSEQIISKSLNVKVGSVKQVQLEQSGFCILNKRCNCICFLPWRRDDGCRGGLEWHGGGLIILLPLPAIGSDTAIISPYGLIQSQRRGQRLQPGRRE